MATYDDPRQLRQRANDLREVLRSVTDEKAVEVLEAHIAELEGTAQLIEAGRPPSLS
jgi:hypothetical protein